MGQDPAVERGASRWDRAATAPRAAASPCSSRAAGSPAASAWWARRAGSAPMSSSASSTARLSSRRRAPARPSSTARRPELVAEADVAVVHDHRQAALLALGDRAGALVTEAVLQHVELGAGRDHAHHLQRRAGRRGEPRRPRQHGVADRRGRPLQPGADRLGDEEGVARRRLVQGGDVVAVAGELAHGLSAQRRQLHPPRAAGRDRGGHPPERVVGGELVVAEGDDEERRRRGDAPREERRGGRGSPRPPSGRPR